MNKEYKDISIEKESSKRKKIGGMDGLKAFAIVGITLFHMFPDTVKGGYFGVSLFLFLTGYLLAYTGRKEWEQGRYTITNYFKKRIIRIYLPLVMVLLVTVGVYSFFLPSAIQGIRGEIISILLGYNNWWQISQEADYFTRISNASPFTHLWFMGIEMQYLLFWPFLFAFVQLCMLWRKKGLGFLVLGALALFSASLMFLFYIPGQDVTRLYYGTDTRLYALLFGAILGLQKAEEKERRPRNMAFRILDVCFFLALLGGMMYTYLVLDGGNPVVYQWALFVSTLGYMWMVHIVTKEDLPLGKILDASGWRWLGQQSYGIFLWQYPIIYFFQDMKWEEAWGQPFLYHGLILLSLLVFTYLTDTVTKGILSFPKHGLFPKTVKQAGISLLTAMIFVCMGWGAWNVAASPGKKEDIQALKGRLEINAAKQAEENRQAAERAAIRAAKETEAVNRSLIGVACIGDSVMLGGEPSLRKVFPESLIDAKVSRYVGDGLAIAKEMDSQGLLGQVVLIGLGTNGPITDEYAWQTEELISYLGDKRDIFWVNIYGPHLSWEKKNNAYLEKLAAEHGNVKIIDWHTYIVSHLDWLGGDNIHLNDTGVEKYAAFIRGAMEKELRVKERNKE